VRVVLSGVLLFLFLLLRISELQRTERFLHSAIGYKHSTSHTFVIHCGCCCRKVYIDILLSMLGFYRLTVVQYCRLGF